MKQVVAIGLNTFRAAIRDRVLYSILVFAAFIIAASLVAQEITIGDQFKVVRGVAQSAISVLSALIAMFFGVGLIWRELDHRTVYNVLSKPVPRRSFVLGKYVGLMASLWLQVAIMATVYVVFVGLQQGWPHVSFFQFALLLCFELALLAAWATLFSTASSQTTAAGFTVGIFFIGHLADDIWRFGQAHDSAWVQDISAAMYWLLPNFEVFNVQPQAAHEMAVAWGTVFNAAVYGVAYTVVVVAATMAVFGRKDLQ